MAMARMESLLQELQKLLQEHLEARAAEANALARCCSHAEQFIERRPSDAEQGQQDHGFDVEKWRHWRQLQAQWWQLKGQEPALKEAAKKARDAWRQQLFESSRSACAESDASDVQKACALARLCKFAAEEVLPSPEAFFTSRGMWPEGVEEQEQLLLELDRWIARLVQDAEAAAPDVARAQEAVRRFQQAQPEPPEPEVAEPSPERAPHPLALLQLPGGEDAARSVLLAQHRARQMELEAQVMRICCEGRPNLLDEVQEVLNQASCEEDTLKALEVLRMVEYLCSGRRTMMSVWPLPSESVEVEKWREGRDLMRFGGVDAWDVN